MVQEGALTALASVADCSQEEFVRYYDTVMPLLSTIMLNAQQKEHRWGVHVTHNIATWITACTVCSGVLQ